MMKTALSIGVLCGVSAFTHTEHVGHDNSFKASLLHGNGDVSAPDMQISLLHSDVMQHVALFLNTAGKPGVPGLLGLVDLMTEDAEFCFPYPHCVDKTEATAFLTTLNGLLTDGYLVGTLPVLVGAESPDTARTTIGIPKSRVIYNEYAGEMWGLNTAFFFPTDEKKSELGDEGCLIADTSYVMWDLEGKEDASEAKVSSLRVYFDTQSRLETISECDQGLDPSQIIMGANEAPTKAEAAKIRTALEKQVNHIIKNSQRPSTDPRWAGAWAETLAPAPATTHFCDPYPTTCFAGGPGGENITKFFEGFVPYVSRGHVFNVAPMVISGTTGVSLSTWTDVSRDTNCIASHYQLGEFRLEEGTDKLNKITIYYNSDAYNYERRNCGEV